MSKLYDVIAWDAKMKEAFDRIEALLDRTTTRSDRILEMLQLINEHLNRPADKRPVGGGPSMSDEHIKATMEQLTVSHIEFDRREGRRRIKLLLDEREKSLPADVPLPKRGFGVMDENGP